MFGFTGFTLTADTRRKHLLNPLKACMSKTFTQSQVKNTLLKQFFLQPPASPASTLTHGSPAFPFLLIKYQVYINPQKSPTKPPKKQFLSRVASSTPSGGL